MLKSLFPFRVLVSISLEEGVEEVSWQDELLCAS